MMDKNSLNYQNRNLSDVFKELQAKQENTKKKKISTPDFNMSYMYKNSKIKNFIGIDITHTIIIFAILIVFTFLFLNKAIFANTNMSDYEINTNVLDMQNIISKNADINTFKEQAITEYNIVYATIRTNNPSLPKGEEIITKEGKLGKEKITSVKTYKNQQLIDELILYKETISNPESQYMDVGTSEFLAKHKVHIGDTMYVTKDISLQKSTSKFSEKVTDIVENMDVKLLELPNEEWAKVSFDNNEGYIKTSNLTSATSNPEIVDKNRIMKIMSDVSINMKLNKSSGLTKKDFKKILSDLSEDKNNIFKDNYEVFYNMDKKYNINGVFLASIAIHESGWGSSTIADDKKNLFGYGAYDSSPYESSVEFSDYSNGIETVAAALAKHYLNTSGTKINDTETADGIYYNEPTVAGVNVRYASDPDWHTKVFNYMQILYDRL